VDSAAAQRGALNPVKKCTHLGAATGHPLMRSLEPGEDWAWCYVDEVALAWTEEERPAVR